MPTDAERQRGEDEERSQIAEDQHRSDFRAMMHSTATAPVSGWRSIVFTVVAWSLAGWAVIATLWWLGSSEKIDMFSAKKPSATHHSR